MRELSYAKRKISTVKEQRLVGGVFPDIIPAWQKHFAHGNQRKRSGPARTDSASACRQKTAAKSWQGADKKVEKR